MAKNVKSTVKLNMPMVRKLTAAAATSLEMTAEAIHTDVVQSQVIPKDTGKLQGESTHISAGKSETATYENGQTVTNGISKAVNGKVISTAGKKIILSSGIQLPSDAVDR